MSISSLVMAGVLGASAQVGESGSMITLNVQVDGYSSEGDRIHMDVKSPSRTCDGAGQVVWQSGEFRVIRPSNLNLATDFRLVEAGTAPY